MIYDDADMDQINESMLRELRQLIDIIEEQFEQGNPDPEDIIYLYEDGMERVAAELEDFKVLANEFIQKRDREAVIL
jgi:hypothetical protein